MAEVYDNEKRHITYHTPPVYSFMTNYPRSLSMSTNILNPSADKAIFYNISLPQLSSAVQAFTANLHILSCKEDLSGDFSGNLMIMDVPWSNEDTYKFIR